MTQPFRLLVTGTQENSDAIKNHVFTTLDGLTWMNRRQVVVVHGRCPRGGVDLYADQWAIARGHTPEPHPANWAKHGRGAGPIRNGEMVAAGADFCVGFPGPGSKGTWDCLRQAVDAGIPTEVHAVGPWLEGGDRDA